jgi:hypothetical protein
MSIDTNNPYPAPANRGQDEVIPAERKIAPRHNFDALLTYLDGYFQPLLEEAKVKQAPRPATSASRLPDRMKTGPDDEELQARDEFLAAQGQAPGVMHPAPLKVSEMKPITRALLRGMGPPVFIGFDAEWQQVRKGRNRLLMVQFHMIGPTGERLDKVIEVENGECLDARPSLAEAIDELLDEAESYCIFDEWPCEVILCGFFTLADLPVFRDAKKFIRQTQGVNGTLATVGKPAELKIPLSDARANRLKSRYSFIVGDNFDPRMVSVRLIDANRLAPPGASLAKVGDWLGLEKMTLPPGYIKSDMARLQRDRPDFFKAYGLRDAELAALYVLWVLWFCNRRLGLKGLSATLSGLGVRLSQLCMREDGVHPDVALNFTKVREWRWSAHHGRPLSETKRVATQVRQWLEPFLADAYLGGRNECYRFGPTPVAGPDTRLYDHDLAGCYVVSLAGVMALDYERVEVVRDEQAFVGHVAGFAQVEFRFPPDVEYPCLPVMVGNYGLWFPLSGVSIATAPEIELALMMGATINVKFGVVIPWMAREEVFQRSQKMMHRKKTVKAKEINLEWDGDVLVPAQEMQFPPESHGDRGYRPFESFSIYTRTERLKYKKKSLPNEFMKGVGNTCYGKSGQGYKEKRSMSPKEMDSVKIGKSAISEAATAALTSGFARAVLGEILWKLPSGTMVVSATTDGLLVDVEKLDLSGPLCQRFQALVERVAPGTDMTELKHLIVQAVAAKTRLQLTGEGVVGQEPVVAKGGIKVLLDSAEGDEAKELELLKPANQNKFVLDLFVNRYPGQVIKRPSLMSMRDVLLNDWDMQTVDRDMTLNVEFDFKRRPVDPCMIKIESHGVEHLAFRTVPWASAEEGALIRTLFDQWRRGKKGDDDSPPRCLKTLEDWHDWQVFQGLYAGNRRRVRQYLARQEESPGRPRLNQPKASSDDPKMATPLLPGPGGTSITRGVTGMRYARGDNPYLGIAIRTFLAAYVQRTWGLQDVNLSQVRLAKWLTDVGFKTEPYHVKNAGRTQLYEHVVPLTNDVARFLKAVKERFPGLEVDRFLVTEN